MKVYIFKEIKIFLVLILIPIGLQLLSGTFISNPWRTKLSMRSKISVNNSEGGAASQVDGIVVGKVLKY